MWSEGQDANACPRCDGTGKVPMSLWAWLLTWKIYGPRENSVRAAEAAA